MGNQAPAAAGGATCHLMHDVFGHVTLLQCNECSQDAPRGQCDRQDNRVQLHLSSRQSVPSEQNLIDFLVSRLHACVCVVQGLYGCPLACSMHPLSHWSSTWICMPTPTRRVSSYMVRLRAYGTSALAPCFQTPFFLLPHAKGQIGSPVGLQVTIHDIMTLVCVLLVWASSFCFCCGCVGH